MNQKERSEYSALTIRQQNRVMKGHIRPIYDALRITVDDFLNDARTRGIGAATSRLYTVVTNQPLAEEIQILHEEAGLFFGRKAYREIQRSARGVRNTVKMGSKDQRWVYVEKAGFGFNIQWAADIIAYFTQDLFALVQQITETTRQQILSVLTQATNEGKSFEWIENQLTSPQLVAWRARLIARTETAKGAFAGRQLANRDSEWETEKEWISAHDKRTRHGHLKVDGEVIDSDARFQVPGPKGTEMMIGPGDPTASASQVCNCRCSLASVAKRDANGRLVRKQPALTAQLT